MIRAIVTAFAWMAQAGRMRALTLKGFTRQPMQLCLRTRVVIAVCAGALGLAFALWELWGW